MLREQLVLCGATAEEADAPPAPKAKRKSRARVGLRMSIRKDGTMHIRHNADGGEAATFCSQALPVTLADAPEGAHWVQIAKVGRFEGHGSGAFEMTAATFDDIVRNYNEVDHGKVAFDFEHASEAPASEGSIPTHGAPAQGWIKQLDNRGQDGLWGLVEWKPLARDYIRAGQYESLSPAIRFNSRHPVTGKPIGARLTSVALTNRPFLRGMMPLAARDEDMPALPASLRDTPIPALPADATLGELFDAIEAHTDTHNSEGDEPEDISPQETTNMSDTIKLKESEAREATLSLQLRDAVASKEAVEKRLADVETEAKLLREWRADREEKDIQNEVNVAFETYKDSKKLRDTDKAAMLVVAKASFDAFQQLYPRVPVAQRALLRSVASEGARPAPKPATDLFALADTIQRDNPGMDREDAIVAADKQMRGAKRRAG